MRGTIDNDKKQRHKKNKAGTDLSILEKTFDHLANGVPACSNILKQLMLHNNDILPFHSFDPPLPVALVNQLIEALNPLP